VTDITPVLITPIDLSGLPTAVFSADALRVEDIAGVLSHIGGSLPPLASSIPAIVSGGVQSAPTGAIQDPAGSAIGAGVPPAMAGAGGASGALYSHFARIGEPLAPIDPIPPCGSVFNRADSRGRRVLHTHSPRLPYVRAAADRLAAAPSALGAIANAYAGAMEAFVSRAPALGADGALLNLVPLSAGIYAGGFLDPRMRHLDPTYTLAAIMLALAERQARGVVLPVTTLCIYDPAVKARTDVVRVELG